MAKKKTPKENPERFAWLICYINSEYIDRVYDDLAKLPEYRDIEVYIPTVKILKKTFKNESHYENVPLLFNYGFFKVPRKFAVYQNFLDGMRQNIACINSWVKDHSKALGQMKARLMEGKPAFTDRQIPIATATSKEIADLVEAAYYTSLHDVDEVNALKPGQVITLRGYPFDNVTAEVSAVYPEKKKVKMKIGILDAIREVEVSFDNVFFTVYHNRNHDDTISTQDSLDEMIENRSIDRKMYKHDKFESHGLEDA